MSATAAAVVLLVAAGLSVPGRTLAATAAEMAIITPATVTCMGATCMATAYMHLTDMHGTRTFFDVAFTIDFEGFDMAVHFTGTLNGTTVIETEITGENPGEACHVPYTVPTTALCIAFSNVNSIGNSLQVCALISAGLINNPPSVVAHLGCFVADTQSSSIKHSILPWARGPSA